jgi:hypothetical protein
MPVDRCSGIDDLLLCRLLAAVLALSWCGREVRCCFFFIDCCWDLFCVGIGREEEGNLGIGREEEGNLL